MKVGQPFNPYGIFQNILIPKVIMGRRDLTLMEKVTYGVLNSHCGPNGEVFPKQETIAQEIGCEVDTVQKAIKKLADKGLIRVKRPTGKDRLMHKANRYVFLWDEALDDSTQMPGDTQVKNSPPDPDGRPYPDPDGRPGANETCLLKRPLKGAGGRTAPQSVVTAFVTNSSTSLPKPSPQPPPKPAPSPKRAKPATTENSGRFQRKFTRWWESAHHGQKFPMNGREAKAIKQLHTYFEGDAAKFKSVVLRFFGNGDRFFAGHAPTKLETYLPQFVAPGTEDDDGVYDPASAPPRIYVESDHDVLDDLI